MSAKVIVMVTVGIMVFGGFDQVGRHCNCGQGRSSYSQYYVLSGALLDN